MNGVVKQAEEWIEHAKYGFNPQSNHIETIKIISGLLEQVTELNLRMRIENDEVGLAWIAAKAVNERLLEDVNHWKANHNDLKQRLAFMTQRWDLPVDRIPVYERLKAENAELTTNLEFAFKRAMVLADMFELPVHQSPAVTGTILGVIRRHAEQLRDQVNRYRQALITIQACYPANATLPWVVTAREALGIHQEEQC